MRGPGRLAIGAPAVAAFTSAASAQKYFGIDVGGSASTRAPSLTNSNGAKESFLGSLTGVGTENVEGLAPGATPPFTLNFVGTGSATLDSPPRAASRRRAPGPTASAAIRDRARGSPRSAAPRRARTSASTSRRASRRSASSRRTWATSARSSCCSSGARLDRGPVGPAVHGGLAARWRAPYAGYINSGEFDRVDFIGTNGADFFAFDDMTVGSLQQVPTTPEPATWILMGTGMGVAGLLSRRRRRA